MKIHIVNNARSFIVSYWNNEASWEDPNPYSIIDATVAAARNEIDVRQQALGAHILDTETGEIYVTCYWDDESIPEEDYPDYNEDNYWDDGCPIEDWGYNEDEGFDPYMGEYTWDC